jgi:CO/xanthine dehydrogenase Mo-binding subunit
MTVSRRDVLRIGATAGGALVVGISLGGCGVLDRRRRLEMQRVAAATGDFVPDAWIRITAASQVIFQLDRVEMGQGTMTSHPMLLAEELAVDPADVIVEPARADRAYDHPTWNLQVTGGSTSTSTGWRTIRKAAATAREMLRAAAAARWEAPLGDCVAKAGHIVHTPTGRRFRYGDLTRTAALIPIPDPELEPVGKQLAVLGKSLRRLDGPSKVDGTAIYGIDVVRPDMLTAVIVRPPRPGARLAGFDGAAADRPGVTAVVELSCGLAVVADRYWRARAAADRLDARWDGGRVDVDTAAMFTAMRAAAESPGRKVAARGNATRALARAAKVVSASYEVPHLAHATMEPQNATVLREDDRCTVWAPTQNPGVLQSEVASLLGLARRDVEVHTTVLGGGFGRRLAVDYAVEAAELADRFRGRPIKVMWSREDDTRHDVYRPMAVHRLRGGLDENGRVVALHHRVVTPSIFAHLGEWVRAIAPDGAPRSLVRAAAGAAGKSYRRGTIPDDTATEGAADTAYQIPHFRSEHVLFDPDLPIGFWRSVGHSHSAFAIESFLDELAAAAGLDPIALRRGLLADRGHHLAVLELAAAKAGWETPLPPGVGRGIAVHASFDSTVAQVVEASLERTGDVETAKVHRVVCAVDCGFVVNPDLARAQIESGVVFGLSAALEQQITFRDGAVVEGNFNDYPLLRMHECPAIEVHFVASDADPTGVGEPGTPPVAPALANAIAAATGRRFRALPIGPQLQGRPSEAKASAS